MKYRKMEILAGLGVAAALFAGCGDVKKEKKTEKQQMADCSGDGYLPLESKTADAKQIDADGLFYSKALNYTGIDYFVSLTEPGKDPIQYHTVYRPGSEPVNLCGTKFKKDPGVVEMLDEAPVPIAIKSDGIYLRAESLLGAYGWQNYRVYQTSSGYELRLEATQYLGGSRLLARAVVYLK